MLDDAVIDELLDLTNHHATRAPAIEQRPGRYLAYFENTFGEQLLFVHDDGAADGTQYLGDVAWEPRRVNNANGLPDLARRPKPRRAHVPLRLLDRDGRAPSGPPRIALKSKDV